MLSGILTLFTYISNALRKEETVAAEQAAKGTESVCMYICFCFEISK